MTSVGGVLSVEPGCGGLDGAGLGGGGFGAGDGVGDGAVCWRTTDACWAAVRPAASVAVTVIEFVPLTSGIVAVQLGEPVA